MTTASITKLPTSPNSSLNDDTATGNDTNKDNNPIHPPPSSSSSSHIQNNQQEHPKPKWPGDEIPNNTSLLTRFKFHCSQWTYSYMYPILLKGSRQKKQNLYLNPSDLYDVPHTMSASYLSNRFRRHRMKGEQQQSKTKKRQQTNAKTTQQQSDDDDDDNNDNNDNSPTTPPPLLPTIFHIASPTFIPAGFCQLIAVVAQVAIPVLVRQILLVVEQQPSLSTRSALPYVILLFVSSILNAVANHRHHHLSFASGIAVRTALVDAMYEKILTATPRGLSPFKGSSSSVTNLVAIDTQKIFEVMQEGHLAWSCPLAMMFVTILLLFYMGPVTIVGMATLVLLIPAVEGIVRRLHEARMRRVRLTDERVMISEEMIRGVRVSKLNYYEGRFFERLMRVRGREVELLKRELEVWSLTLVVTVFTPIVASAATFVTYVMIDDGRTLTASTIFTILQLFVALRFPINYAGKLLGKMAQGYQAAKRVERFLQCESRDDTNDAMIKIIKTTSSTSSSSSSSSSEPSDDGILTISNGHFIVGSDNNNTTTTTTSSTSFTLSNINTTLHRSQILSVIGPVGSGKSTLVNAIVSNCRHLPPSLLTSPHPLRIGLAPQIPFILNATLRDNILFGRPYDAAHYRATMRACGLLPDLVQLGGDDGIEIGERGVTLSGGQKQRVGLARVVYSKPDLAVLDDPWSALDARTGELVARRLLFGDDDDDGTTEEKEEEGLLTGGGCAVVLVTHASYMLPRMDRVMVLGGGRMVFEGTWEGLKDGFLGGKETKSLVEGGEGVGEETWSFLESVVCRQTEDRGMDDDDEVEQSLNDKIDDDTAPMSSSSTAITTSNSPITNGEDTPTSPQTTTTTPPPTTPRTLSKRNSLMTIEEREHGLASLSTWLTWFHYAGGLPFLLSLATLLLLDRAIYVLAEWWLAVWASAATVAAPFSPLPSFPGVELPPQTQSQTVYLVTYSVLIVVGLCFTITRSVYATRGGLRCSSTLFSLATHSLLHAPLRYFETTPSGRILNRLTFDVEALDVTLTQSMSITMIALSWGVAAIVVMMVILPWIVGVMVPVTVCYGGMQWFYRKSASDLQRLDVVSRSPIQAGVAEALDGATCIRLFSQTHHFISRFRSQLDSNASAMLNFISAHRWLAVRIEILGSLVTLVACTLVVCLNDTLEIKPGIVALLITWTSNFTITLGFLVDNISEAEAAITSIERIHSLLRLPRDHEPSSSSSQTTVVVTPSPTWPSTGTLTFSRVSLRYAPHLPPAINDLSFAIPSGCRCGIVGRTGAGKSSIIAALFRLVKIEDDGGSITLDGVDLSTLSLRDVRGRRRRLLTGGDDNQQMTTTTKEEGEELYGGGMVVVPQDPVLFGTTIKECLDPWNELSSSDDDDGRGDGLLEDALRNVRLPYHLTDVVDDGGSNYSVGERQLLCLARAMLSRPRLLVLDEATASVDGETDEIIGEMLRSKFGSRKRTTGGGDDDGQMTLLTIAHRLHTVMDYDLVLVLEGGKMVEFDSPSALLRRGEGGVFHGMVAAMGTKGAKVMKGIADEAERMRRQAKEEEMEEGGY